MHMHGSKPEAKRYLAGGLGFFYLYASWQAPGSPDERMVLAITQTLAVLVPLAAIAFVRRGRSPALRFALLGSVGAIGGISGLAALDGSLSSTFGYIVGSTGSEGLFTAASAYGILWLALGSRMERLEPTTPAPDDGLEPDTPGRPPHFTASAAEFQKADWDELNGAVFHGTEAPRPCPACKRTGCYGSYAAGTRCYRMCKFCGFYQKVGQDSRYLVPTAHACEKAPHILGEPYIQWAQTDEVIPKCFYCDQEYAVESYLAPRPSATPGHGWWAIPQGMDRDTSIAFWKVQGLNDDEVRGYHDGPCAQSVPNQTDGTNLAPRV